MLISNLWISPSTLAAVRGDQSRLVVPPSVFNQLSASLKEIATVMENGDSMDINGITVNAVPAYNDRHPLGRDNGYVVTLGDRRIYMGGDTGATDEMRALTEIDVAFVPMNLPFTMSVEQAADALLAFRPRTVFPYHYRNQNGTFADLDLLRSKLREAPEIELRLGKWY